MSQFASRNTPLPAPEGFQSAALPGTAVLLSALVNVPPLANSAVVQGLNDGVFGFRQDGTEGPGPGDCFAGNEVYLANRSQIAQCVLVNNGGAPSFTVQFFTGRSGA